AACLGQDIRALANHDPRLLLGRNGARSRTLRMREDASGLPVEIDLPDTQPGRDTAVSVRRGDMDGMSFSFLVDPGDDEWDFKATPPVRTIKRFSKVYDGGPVTYAAYLDTTAAMRSLERARTEAAPDPRSLSLAKARQRLAEALQP